MKIGSVVPDSPAQAAGLQDGRSIYALDGTRYQFMLGETILEDLAARPGENVTLTVVGTNGAQRDVEVTLRDAAAIAANQGALGVKAAPGGFELYWSGEYAERPGNRPVHRRAAPGRRARDYPRRARHARELGGIRSDPAAAGCGAGRHRPQLGDIFWGAGPILTLYVAAILSANLAVVNILPFPPLDGGRMLMITLKSLFGARISVRAEQLTYMVGFVFLFAFLICGDRLRHHPPARRRHLSSHWPRPIN